MPTVMINIPGQTIANNPRIINADQVHTYLRDGWRLIPDVKITLPVEKPVEAIVYPAPAELFIPQEPKRRGRPRR